MRTSGSTLISLAIGNAMSDYHVANRSNHGLHQGTRGDFSVAEKKKNAVFDGLFNICLVFRYRMGPPVDSVQLVYKWLNSMFYGRYNYR